MIFVDTGAWFASVVPTDSDHAKASRWLAQNREALVTSDYVVDETLTLLRARRESERALSMVRYFFAGRSVQVHYLTKDEIAEAAGVFERYSDKAWSFTDCTSKVLIERLGIIRAFAFDEHFRQFGTVAVLP